MLKLKNKNGRASLRHGKINKVACKLQDIPRSVTRLMLGIVVSFYLRWQSYSRQSLLLAYTSPLGGRVTSPPTRLHLHLHFLHISPRFSFPYSFSCAWLSFSLYIHFFLHVLAVFILRLSKNMPQHMGRAREKRDLRDLYFEYFHVQVQPGT